LFCFSESDEQKLDRKRHIGNDLVVIIYWEGPGSFDASKLVTQMCHVFIVFERIPSLPGSQVPRYRVGVVCRSGVQPFKPYLPSPSEFDADENLRTWLFMKIINGERATFQAKTFLTKTSTARKTLLDKIARETLAVLGPDAASFTAPNLMLSRMVMREPMTRLKATSAFQGVTPSHLSFKKGDEIILYCRPSAEWWNGGIGGKRGDFPQSKVVEKDRKEKRKWGKPQQRSDSNTSSPAISRSGGLSNSTFSGVAAVAALADVLPTHEVAYTIGKVSNLPGCANATSLSIKTHIVSVNGTLDGSARQTSKIAKGGVAVEFGESFVVRILDPMWEVLHIDVIELGSDPSSAPKSIGTTEIACGEMIVNCDGSMHDYPFEGVEGAYISLAVDKVTQLQQTGLQRSMTAIAATERKNSNVED
jgi:hypothetical protein